MRILFVDDRPDTRDMFRLALAMYGHAIRLASDGFEAVAAVTEEDFDAIVMDVEMPGMNGWEAVRQIRLMDKGHDVPIVMFTAYGNSDFADKVVEVGANDLIEKPILPKDLLFHIKKHVPD